MGRLNKLSERIPAAPELLRPQSHWQLTAPLDLFSGARGQGLATQAAPGRRLRLLAEPSEAGRLQVQLLEDGYRGWISLETHWTGPNGDKFEASTICGRNLKQLVS